MADKELCRVLDPPRSLDNKNLCVSFVAVCNAPRGLRKGFAQVVCLKDGASSVSPAWPLQSLECSLDL